MRGGSTIKLATQRRERRRRRPFPVSPFSIFLLGFGALFSILVIFTVVTSGSCRFDLFWLNGWFGGGSALQALGAAVLGAALLFLIETIVFSPWRRKFVEWAMQAVFIAGLLLAFGALKAYLLPFSFPTAKAYEHIAALLYGPPPRYAVDARVNFSWTYDYPPPPPNPRETPPPDNAELFSHEASPYWSELQAVQQCIADRDAAEAAYEKWEQGFEEWLDQNPRS